jgi:protein-disulfide isomerase/uncharacterized membrane protein
MIRMWRLLSVIVLCLAGAAISLHLTNIHINHIKTGVPSSCNFNESFNCDAVNTSRWSELFGVPVAHLGMLTYMIMLGLASAALGSEPFRRRAHAYLLAISGWCLLFSAYMAFVALVLIKSVCVWCAALYTVNLMLLLFLAGGGIAALKGLPRHITEDWKWVRGPAGIGLALVTTAAVAGSSLYLRSDLQSARMIAASQRVPRVHVDVRDAPAAGPENAPLTIVEISDFECPFCRQASATLERVLEEYKGKYRLYFKHFPLDNACNPSVGRPFHTKACEAAGAAACAQMRGAFWPYVKMLLSGPIGRESLLGYAKAAGLDPGWFGRCLASAEAAGAVARDVKSGMEMRLDGVPVFIFNGRKVVGAQPPETFRSVIEEELAAAR